MNPLQNKLDAITADIEATIQKQTKNAAERARVKALGEPAQQECQNVETLRQQRADILSRLIIAGAKELTSPELEAADAAIEASRPTERKAQDLLNAQANVLDKLRTEADELAQHLNDQRRNLLMTKHAAAEAEITGEAIPEFLAAVQALSRAYGRLNGLTAAHHVNADLIQERFGVSRPHAVGERFPRAQFTFHVYGFHGVLPANGAITIKPLDMYKHTATDALARWSSIGEEVPSGLEARIHVPNI